MKSSGINKQKNKREDNKEKPRETEREMQKKRMVKLKKNIPKIEMQKEI